MAFNKLVHFETKSQFNNQLENLNDLSIAFIKDTGELWTHGRLFGGYFSNVDNNKVKLVIGNVEKLLSLDGHTQSYTTLTGSGTTANQAIVSTGTANKWTLKTLGKNAFSNEDFLPVDGTAVAATNIAGGVKGSIPYQTASSKTAMLAPPTVNGYVLKFNTTTGIPYWAADNNTTYTTKVLKVNNTSYNVYTSSSSLPTLWAPSSLGTANQVLKVNSTGDGLTWGTDNNSDTKVLQSETTTANYRPILFGYNNSSSVEDLTNSVTQQAYTTSNIYVQPSTGSLWATKLYSGGKLVVTDVSNYVTLNTAQTITGQKTFTSQINSPLNTSTYLKGNKGKAIINSTAGAGQYVMLFKGNSTNGYFTHGVYQGKYLLQYTVKSTVDAGTNAVTKSVTLLDESGNMTAPKFIGFLQGNADSATKLTTSAGSATRPIYFSDGKPVAGTYTFGNASGNAAINNGTVNSNLNADLLDGLHSSSFLRLQTISGTTDVNTLKDTRLYYTTSDAASQELVNPPFTNTFSMIQVANLINGDTDWRRSIIAFNPYGDMKTFNDRGTSGDGGVWYTVLTSGNYSSILDTRYPTKTGGGASGTWGISISGNAATASKWATARTITLGSYLSGSVSLDGSTNVTLNANVNGLTSQGAKTAISGTTKPSSGLRMYEAYNNGYPTSYGNLISVSGSGHNGAGELLLSWNNGNRIYYRSIRDVTDSWLGWSTVAFLTDNVASATTATTVKVTQHTTNNTNYPIVWSNEPNTSSNSSDLYKSWQHLYYNPSTQRLTATGGFIKGGSSDSYVLLGGGGHKALSDLGSSHTHSYLPLSGGTMNGGAQIKRAGISKSWVTGREGALIRQTSIDGYSPLISMKTSEGSWDIGVYDSNRLHFSYITDSNYSSRTNKQTANIYLGSSGVIYSNGFQKSGSSSAYVLLGDGGHTTLSGLGGSHTHTIFRNNIMLKGTNGISDSASIHLALGDSDTGFKWISDGVCQIYANNIAIGQWNGTGMNWLKQPLVNGEKVWHAGNDGSGSGLDADLLDGRQANSFVYINGSLSVSTDLNDVVTPGYYKIQADSTSKNPNLPEGAYQYGMLEVIAYPSDGEHRTLQLYYEHKTNGFWRRMKNNTSWHNWSYIPTSTENIASATNADKLDGIHANGLLTALSSSSATNLSITVGGTTKTIADLYATQAVNSDTLDNLHASSFMRCDGTNGISLTGGNGNTAGWRLVLEKTCGGQSINNIVMSVVSRHTGQGILSIGFHTTNESGTTYSSSINFKGSTASNGSNPWRAFYNTSTKKFRLFWYYNDYNSTYINALNRIGFDTPKNGTWYETLPSDNGTELTVLYNNASKLGTSTVGGATTPIYLNGGSPTACSASTSGTASTIAVRDSNGDLQCRLVRPTYANQTTISGALAYRVNNSSDNYIRFCSDTAAIRTWLGVPSSSQLNKYLPLTGGTMTGTITSTNIDPIIIQNDTGPWIIKHQRSDGYEKGLYTADGYGVGLIVNNSTLTNGVYINKSGNVGIGTTAPTSKFHTKGNSTIEGKLTIINNSKSSLFLNSSGYSECSMYYVSNNSYGWYTGCGVLSKVGFSIGTILSGTESTKFFIDNSGNVGIGTTAPSYKLQVEGEIQGNTVITNHHTYIIRYAPTGDWQNLNILTRGWTSGVGDWIKFEAPGTSQQGRYFRFGTNEGLTTNYIMQASEGFFEQSDIRLKKDIAPITNTQEIELVSFTWKKSGKKSYGVIAQQIEKNYPELVETIGESGYKTVKYDAVLVVKAAQLENKIKQLENKIKQLEEKLKV